MSSIEFTIIQQVLLVLNGIFSIMCLLPITTCVYVYIYTYIYTHSYNNTVSMYKYVIFFIYYYLHIYIQTYTYAWTYIHIIYIYSPQTHIYTCTPNPPPAQKRQPPNWDSHFTGPGAEKKALAESGNPFSSEQTLTHARLLKNEEWGESRR